MENEIWKDIPKWEGYYQVSNLARVKSLERKIYNTDGGLAYNKKEKIIVQYGKIYKQVNFWKESKQYHYYVHFLVAICFVENQFSKPMVNYKDGVKFNNIPENLEWVTKSENSIHAYSVLGIGKNINRRKGGNHPNSKKVVQFSLDGVKIKEWVNISEANNQFNGKKVNIGMCCNGKLKTSGGFIWEYA